METIKCEDFLQYRFFSALDISPGGSSAIFCLSQAIRETNNYANSLWLYDRRNEAIAEIPGTQTVNSFCYLNEESILFPLITDKHDKEYIDRGGFLTVFKEKNLITSECSESFRVPLKNAKARLVKPGLFLLACVRDNARPDIESLPEEERAIVLEKWQEEAAFEVCDEMPFMINGQGFVSKKRHSLYLYDEKRKGLSELTTRNFEVSNFAINSDGRYIAYSGVSYDRYYIQTHGIYLYNTETKTTVELLTPGSYQIMGLDFLNDEIVAAAAPWSGEGSYPNHHLYTLPLSGGEMRLRYTHTNEDFGNKTGSDCRYGTGSIFKADDEHLYYFTTCDTAAYINKWRPGEKPIRLNNEAFIPDSIAVCHNEILATGTAGGLQEIFRIDNDGLHHVSNINTEVLRNKIVNPPHKLQFKNSDGLMISGFVIEPTGYEPGKKYPGILEIHGGPRTAFTAGFFHEMQFLAGKGYFVFFCNPRGSAGCGEAFADIRTRWGTVDFADVMEWTDFVLKQYPAIDASSLAVMGGSYGGYMTNWCITHTNRFRAAVSMRSVANLFSDYGATDYSIWGTPGVHGGTPWSNAELLKKQSPYSYAMNITTPTLFIHSFEDYRCSLSGAMQMYSAMQKIGVPTRMCLFRSANHELSRSGSPRSRIRRLREIAAWVDRYLIDK